MDLSLEEYRVLASLGDMVDKGVDPPYRLGTILSHHNGLFPNDRVDASYLLSFLTTFSSQGLVSVGRYKGRVVFSPTDELVDKLSGFEPISGYDAYDLTLPRTGGHLIPNPVVVYSMPSVGESPKKLSEILNLGRKDYRSINTLQELGYIEGSQESGFKLTPRGLKAASGIADTEGEVDALEPYKLLDPDDMPSGVRSMRLSKVPSRILSVLSDKGTITLKQLQYLSHTDRRQSGTYRNLLVAGLIDMDSSGNVWITEDGMLALKETKPGHIWYPKTKSSRWAEYFSGIRGMGTLLEKLPEEARPDKSYRSSLTFKPKVVSRSGWVTDTKAMELLKELQDGKGKRAMDVGDIVSPFDRSDLNLVERMLVAGLITANTKSFNRHRRFKITDRGRSALGSMRLGESVTVKPEDFDQAWVDELKGRKISTPTVGYVRRTIR